VKPSCNDDRKPLSPLALGQERYLRLEVGKLNATPTAQLSRSDASRLYVIAPLHSVDLSDLEAGPAGWLARLFYAFSDDVSFLLSVNVMEARFEKQ